MFQISVDLKPHQKDGVEWIKKLESSKSGGIIADHMGTGKTITYLSHLLTDSEISHVNLIVTTKSLLLQLYSEILSKTNIPKEKIYIYQGIKKCKKKRKTKINFSEYFIVLTTYGVVLSDYNRKKKNQPCPLFQYCFYRIALDEAHWIRTKNNQTTIGVLNLKGVKKWCITGTPFNNYIEDLHVLNVFMGIQPYNDIKWWNQNKNNPKSISHWTKNYVLLRGKEVLNLPDCKYETLWCEFSEKEKQSYEMVIQDAYEAYRKWAQKKALFATSNLLVHLNRMQKICNHPILLLGRNATRHLSKQSQSSLVSKWKNQCFQCHEKKVFRLLCGHCVCNYCLDSQVVSFSPPVKNSTFKTYPIPISNESPNSKKRKREEWDENSETDEDEGSDECGSQHDDDYIEEETINHLPSICKMCHDLLKKWSISPLSHSSFSWNGHEYLESTKIIELTKYIENELKIESTSKFIIFSQWTSSLDLIEKSLEKRNISLVRYDGDVKTTKQRNNLVDQFQTQKDCIVFLSSLKCGGCGLNLTSANHVILFDTCWNPYLIKQAVDRAHRMGQTRTVKVVTLHMKNSIEDNISQIQKKKIQEGNRILKGVGVEDLQKEDRMESFEHTQGLSNDEVFSIFKKLKKQLFVSLQNVKGQILTSVFTDDDLTAQ